jgi:uracil-DNA glycosylase
MKVDLPISWKNKVANELNQPYFIALQAFLEQEYQSHRCFPPKAFIFEAFNQCSWENLKVVILGQDPYHGFGQANGLCFSVYDGVAFPPSLRNIFKELESDLALPIPISGNLERWAAQGVLLLNATLTVREGMAGSHQKQGWEEFTDAIITLISNEKEGIIFLLWGGFAQKKGSKIDEKKHFLLKAGHPSPLSANRGFWFGNSHFSKTNQILTTLNKKPIDW